MIESYRKAIPDHGVDRLEQELRTLIGDLGDNLNVKINELDVRVSALEQTGTMAMSAAVVNNDNRTVNISVIATDHTAGTSVTFNITDSNNNVATGSAVLTDNQAGDKQLANVIIPIATLESGTLNVVATSTDEYGKTRTDTVIRTYSPVASALTVETLIVDYIQRRVSISVHFNTGIPITDLMVDSEAKLTITDASDDSVIIANVTPSRGMSATPVLVWDDVELHTDANAIDIKIASVDAYGEPATGERLNTDISEINDAGILITTGTANNETYAVNLEAVLWHSDGSNAVIEAGGETRSMDGDLATVVPYVGNDPDLDYTGAEKYTWSMTAQQLPPETITATVTSTDSLGRTSSEDRSIPYAPLGRLTLDWNGVNSAAKTLELIFDTTYISIGQTATVNLSSPVNGYSETHTTTVDYVLFNFPPIDLSAFPFGRINQQVSVIDRLGNIITWDGFVMFEDVQGSLTWANPGISSASDVATARWRQTGVVTVDRVIVTDEAGVTVMEDEIITSPNDGTAFKVDVDISTLRYGSVVITVEGRDGANSPLTLTNVEQYKNEEGVLEVTSIEFNPYTERMRIKGRYDNIKSHEAPIQFIHKREGVNEPGTTNELLWPENNVLRSFDETIPYSYADGQAIEYYLKSLDIKGDEVVSPTETIVTGSSGTLEILAVVNNVTSVISLSASVNASVSPGSTITFTISDSISLTATATVSGGTASATVQLPAIYGDITVNASVVDIYGETIRAVPKYTSHSDVNGSISISEFKTQSTSLKMRIKGTTDNVANGKTITVYLMEKGSSTVRVSGTTTVSNNAYQVDITIPGGVTTSLLPYGNVTAKVSTDDAGGSVVSATKDGIWSATPATVSAAVVTKDLVNGTIKMSTSFDVIRTNVPVRMKLFVNGHTYTYSKSAEAATGTMTKTFDISSKLSSSNDIDFEVEVYDYTANTRTARVDNISWDNSSTISISSITRAATSDTLTVKGVVTKVPKDWQVSARAFRSGTSETTSTINSKTTAADTGNGAPFSINVDISSLSNGTATVRVSVEDQQGAARTASASHTWDGHGSIVVKDGLMTFGTDDASVYVDADLSNKWGATPNYKAELLRYDNSTDTTGTVIKTITFANSNSNNGLSWQDSNTLRSHFYIPGLTGHGWQFQVRFSAVDAAGDTITKTGGSRSILTNALPASFTNSITPNGKHPQTGESLFVLKILNHIPYSRYGNEFPTVTYVTPSGQTLSASVAFTHTSGSTYHYSFKIADVSTSGTYKITAKLRTARSNANRNVDISTTIDHVKEEPAALRTTSFYVRTRYFNNRETVAGINAGGTLDAASPANKTVYADLRDMHNDDVSTYTDVTDSVGKWAIVINGYGGLTILDRTTITCDARTTYAGRSITADRRSAIVSLRNNGQVDY